MNTEFQVLKLSENEQRLIQIVEQMRRDILAFAMIGYRTLSRQVERNDASESPAS